jgi:hypothetical protein
MKKLFDSRVIFRHISPVFSRGQAKQIFFEKVFFARFDL